MAGRSVLLGARAMSPDSSASCSAADWLRHADPRQVLLANADQAYAGILDLADRIDREHLAHYVGVFRRSESESRYHNMLDAVGAWTARPALREAIEGERERPWTRHEAADFLRTHPSSKQNSAVGGQPGSTRSWHRPNRTSTNSKNTRTLDSPREAEKQLEAGA